MQPDSPAFPHTWSQWVYAAVAGFLLYGGGLITAWFRRKHGPAEIAKLQAETGKIDAETRSVDANTNITLIQAAGSALAKAERLQDICNHLERKNEALQRENDLLNIEVNSMDVQMKRLHGFIKAKGWSFSEYDTPKRLD